MNSVEKTRQGLYTTFDAMSAIDRLAVAVPDFSQKVVYVDQFTNKSITGIIKRLVDSGDEPFVTNLVAKFAGSPVSVARWAASISVGHDISMLDCHADDEDSLDNRLLNFV